MEGGRRGKEGRREGNITECNVGDKADKVLTSVSFYWVYIITKSAAERKTHWSQQQLFIIDYIISYNVCKRRSMVRFQSHSQPCTRFGNQTNTLVSRG